MSDINEDEVFEKKKKREMPKIFKNCGETIKKHKKKFIAGFVALILVIVVAVLALTGTISNLFTINQVGNSAGNIMNCGYSVENGDYIYYVSPSEDMLTTTVSKVKKGSKDAEVIYEGAYDIRALNIVGNKIYFINLGIAQNEDSGAETQAATSVDARICKMNLDGSDYKVLNDNDFAYQEYNMYVLNSKIYYIGSDNNVYSMNLNGGNRKLVLETHNSLLSMNKEYIIYDKEKEDGSDFVTCICKLDGSNEREVNGGRIHTPIINDGYIYYLNADEKLAKSPINGGDEEIVLDRSVYNMNIYNGYLYCLDYKDESSQDYTVVINKINLEGGQPELVKELTTYSSFLNIVGGYAYYMDMDETNAFINLVNVDNSEEIKLHEWNYANN